MIERNKNGKFVKGHKHSLEVRMKLSAKMKGKRVGIKNPFYGKRHTEESKKKNADAHKGKPSPYKEMHVSDERKRKQSQIMKGRKPTAEQRRKMKANASRYWAGKAIPENAKKKMSERKKLSWQDPAYVKKIMEGRHLSPNKSELELLKLLEKLYPGEWKYTGDFSFTINGKCPDFVNCNGQKKVIEFNGTYWHQNDIPGERKKLFAEFGYDTLIIWDSEMKNIDNIESRIRIFHEGNKE